MTQAATTLPALLASLPSDVVPTAQQGAAMQRVLHEAQNLIQALLDADAAAYTAPTNAPAGLPGNFKYIERIFGQQNRPKVRTHYINMKQRLATWENSINSANPKVFISGWCDEFEQKAESDGRGDTSILTVPSSMPARVQPGVDIPGGLLNTVIHEASHAADENLKVIDISYIPDSRFPALIPQERLINASNYEVAMVVYQDRATLTDSQIFTYVGNPDNLPLPPAPAAPVAPAPAAPAPAPSPYAPTYIEAVKMAQTKLQFARIQSDGVFKKMITLVRNGVNIPFSYAQLMNLPSFQNAGLASYALALSQGFAATVADITQAIAFSRAIRGLHNTFGNLEYDSTIKLQGSGKLACAVVEIAAGQNTKWVAAFHDDTTSWLKPSTSTIADVVLKEIIAAAQPPVPQNSGVDIETIKGMANAYAHR